MDEHNYDTLIDPRLGRNYNPNEMARMISCAASCVRHSARRRPKMSQVVICLCISLISKHIYSYLSVHFIDVLIVLWFIFFLNTDPSSACLTLFPRLNFWSFGLINFHSRDFLVLNFLAPVSHISNLVTFPLFLSPFQFLGKFWRMHIVFMSLN